MTRSFLWKHKQKFEFMLFNRDFFYKQASGSGEDDYRMQGAYDDDNDDNADGGQLAQFDNKTSAQVT